VLAASRSNEPKPWPCGETPNPVSLRVFLDFLTANGRELTRIRHFKSKGYGDFKHHPQDEFKDFCNSLKIRVHWRSFAVPIFRLSPLSGMALS
jgi:hypothetical protein